MYLHDAFNAIEEELKRQVKSRPAFNTAGEGYLTIQQAIQELRKQITVNPSEAERYLMQNEAVKVASAAVRFLFDLTP